MGVQPCGDRQKPSGLSAFVAQSVPPPRWHNHHHRPDGAHTDDLCSSMRRRIGPSVAESQLDYAADGDQMVGLMIMPMPVRDAIRPQFHPIDLLRSLDAGPVRPEYFSHPTAASEDIAKFQNLDAGDLWR